jgi:hypothetical protein
MHKVSKKSIILFVIIALVWTPFTGVLAQEEAMYEENNGGKMAVDVVLVRPLSFVASVLGAGLFVVALPFSALGGNVGPAWRKMVAAPGRYTFSRPLGEFH